jgi:hypothetical protein
MAAGRLRMGMTMVGSVAHTEHVVAADQPEPGVPPSAQPTRHLVDLGLLEWQFDTQLGFSRRFAVEAVLPVRVAIVRAGFERNGKALPDARSIHHRDETLAGVGDLILTGRIGLVTPQDVRRLRLDVRLGSSMPTGGIERDPFALGRAGREHQHIFFGSGTIDPVLGLEAVWSATKFGFTAWTLGRVAAYRNHLGYHPPSTVTAGVAVLASFGLARWRFALQPEVFHETRAQWGNEYAVNSGRTSLIAAGGAFVRATDGLQVHAILKVPYLNITHGGQYRWPIVALLGFSWTLDLARYFDRGDD